MRKYELAVILDSRLSKEDKEGVIKEASDIISKSGGKILNSKLWLERQKFTFPIKKCTEGTYYLINFESEGSGIPQIRPALNLNERILRFAVHKAE